MHVIFYSGIINKRKGGPSGYLGYLYESINHSKIVFITSSQYTQSLFSKIYEKFPIIVKNIRNKLFLNNSQKIIDRSKNYFLKSCVINNIDFHNIKSIHFHTTLDFFFFIENYKNYNGIKILTTHTPTMPFIERLDGYKYLKKAEKDKLFEFFKKVDLLSFKEADYLILPSKNSLEHYYETCKDFKEIIKNKKIKYLYTGVEKLQYKIERDVFRRKYGLENKFVVSYVGRHNLVKGFDILMKAAELIWQIYPDIYFLIAGKKGPLKGIKDKRWIEIGWTDDPGSIINASDVFVLPNRQTFFDLVLLETLSLGKISVVSFTGGNKEIVNLTSGVIGFEKENVDDLVKKLLYLYNLPEDKRIYLEKENIEIYEKYFTTEIMGRNYIKIIEEIYNENNLCF